MKFCDKLPKLRKDNNLSQEQLADKLGVSRQAVSKWESGSSYPDMEKMLQICSILNCTLDNLMDDGTIDTKSSTTKFNFNHGLQDLLKFITKTYNMFCSMKFKEKIKCLFEMSFIFLILFLLEIIIYEVVSNISTNLLELLPYNIEHFLSSLFDIIYLAILIILGVITFLHLFKIRYLDYFITIEDKNATEKTIEVPVEKKEDKKYIEQKKEKIIIRDPKHSTFSFFEFLGKIIGLLARLFALFAAFPVVCCFVGIIILAIMSIYYLGYNIIFLFITMSFLGASIIIYALIEGIYKFLTITKQNYRRSFIFIIVGLIATGIGMGLTFAKYMQFKEVESSEYFSYDVETKYIEMKDTTVITPFPSDDVITYEIDNSLEKIKIDMYCADGLVSRVLRHDEKFFDSYHINYRNLSFNQIYKLMLNDIKNNQTRKYYDNALCKTKIYLNQKNYDKLSDNHNRLMGRS